jgi:hypothetical protein
MSRIINLSQSRIRPTFSGILGNGNTAVGLNALSKNDGGSGNTVIGDSALLNNITGYGNTSVGKMSLSSNTIGYANTVIGHQSGELSTTGNRNVIIGENANTDINSRSKCVIIGAGANQDGGMKTTEDNQLLIQLGGGGNYENGLMTDLQIHNTIVDGNLLGQYITVWLNWNGVQAPFKIAIDPIGIP